jgi:hypothetical protein
MGSNKRTTDAERAVRRTKAIELRAGHTSYRKIAEILGVSVWTAFNDVQKGIREEIDRRKESTDVVLEFELRRLDTMGAILMQQLRDGDAGEKREAMTALLRVMDRRARYLGLDAPKKVEASVEERRSWDDLVRAKAEELQARRAVIAERNGRPK